VLVRANAIEEAIEVELTPKRDRREYDRKLAWYAGQLRYGRNGYQIRAWKERLQVRVCDRFGLTVTVCHYPTGCSKWNPIEHRLFSQISRNWAGVPLRTWDTLLAFIRGTTTSSGLAVQAILQAGDYPIGLKVTDAEMNALNLERHAVCPTWNYTIRPRTPASNSAQLREVIV
jgi:hypothetical protein